MENRLVGKRIAAWFARLDRISRRRALTAFAAIVGCLATARAGDAEDEGPPASGMRQHAVALENFTRLHAGLSKAAVDRLLGKVGEHEFTCVDREGVAWQCVEYTVAQQPRYASVAFDLLYRQGLLFSLIDSMDTWNHYKALIGLKPDELEDPQRKKDRLSRTLPAAYDDDSRVREFFRVKSVRGEEIQRTMPQLKERILAEERESQARHKRNPADPGLTAVFVVANLLMPSSIWVTARANHWNAQMIKKFDGNRVAVGMTPEQVEQLFGKPVLSQNVRDAVSVAIYGPKERKNLELVQPYLACRPVLVLFRQGAANRVLSNSFFDQAWQDAAWPELKSLQ
jgi:hypothetical protein